MTSVLAASLVRIFRQFDSANLAKRAEKLPYIILVKVCQLTYETANIDSIVLLSGDVVSMTGCQSVASQRWKLIPVIRLLILGCGGGDAIFLSLRGAHDDSLPSNLHIRGHG